MEPITIDVLMRPGAWPEFFATQFTNNDVFSGLLTVSLLGAAAYLGRKGLMALWTLFKRTYLVELTVMSEDPMFQYLKMFLSKTEYVREKCRRLTLSSVDLDEDMYVGRAMIASRPRVALSPTAGIHLMVYKGKPFLYQRTIEDSQGSYNRKETIKLTYVGRGRDLIYDLVSQIDSERGTEEKIRIFTGSRQGQWNHQCDKSLRTLDTIFLPDDQKERIIGDLKSFINGADWYRSRGLPYHRGYLFSGPGGVGKTSTIRAMCSELRKNIGILNLASIHDDQTLFDLFANIPSNTVIVLEDIDASLVAETREHHREEGEEGSGGGVTLSGLLNALDGLATPEGLIVFMTTNYPERLDPALIRVGRVDVHEKFTLPDATTIGKMFDQYFPGNPIERDFFVHKVADKGYSTASLQNTMFMYANDLLGLLKAEV